jgi:hypothetical protein
MTNTDADKLAVIEYQEDGTVLIRGTGFGAIAQFTWAALVPAGAVIPRGKLTVARQALEAMGYHVVEAAAPAERTPERSRRMPLPLPECKHCHAPYRRNHQVGLGEVCTACGRLLELVQHDPNVLDADGQDTTCPQCGRPVRPGWNFCPCGAELNAPRLVADDGDRRPWHQRYADDLASSRSAHLRGLVADLFAMPEGSDQ